MFSRLLTLTGTGFLLRAFRRRSLWLRFAIGASVVASVPLVVTGIFIDRSNTSVVAESVQREHDSALDQATVAIETSVESIFADLKHLSGSPVLSDPDASDQELEAELLRFYDPVLFPLPLGPSQQPDSVSPFEELAVFERSGISAAAMTHQFSNEWSTSKWMTAAREGAVSYSSPHFDLEKHRLVISIAIPVISGTGEVMRIVGAQVDLDRVLALADLDGFAVRDDIDLRLLDRFGNYLAGVDEELLFEKAPLLPAEATDSAVAEFQDTQMAVVGGERPVGKGTIWAGEGWRIRSVEPVATAYADISSARRRLVAGFTSGFALIIVMSILMGRTLSRPLRSIARAVTKFGDGDYEVRLNVSSSDELAKVTTAFNSMADSLENSHRELEDSNRAKSEFISSLSHELRTPLTAMIGFVQILKKNRDGDFTPKTLDRLDVINRNGHRLEAMINDLLDLTKIENKTVQLDMERFEICELVDDISATMTSILGIRQQKLTVYITHGPAWLRGDKNRIAQVLTNLISNASKYSERESLITVVSAKEQDQLRISVRDQGQGLKPEDMEQLFTLFYRTEDAVNSSTPGTGIGLFVSKKMIELHGGTIEVDSQYGEGSTFTVSLPGFSDSVPEVPDSLDSKKFSNRLADPDLKAAG